MARMLGAAARRPRCPVCACVGYVVDKRAQRAREKRFTAAWRDEHRHPDFADTMCTRDGLLCTCNRPPEECDPWRGETWPR